MIHLRKSLALVFVVALALVGVGAVGAQSDDPPPIPETRLPLDEITLPEGFEIHIYSDEVSGARQMELAPDGTLFVGTRQQGRVYALRDEDGNNHAEVVHTIAQGMYQPNGVVFHDGSLYIAQIDKLVRLDNVLQHVDERTQPQVNVVTDRFLDASHHGWKYMRMGEDGKLYVPQGVPCNVCAEAEEHGLLARMNPDGTEYEVIARGIRNTVGFDWNPETGDLWFTDNGRDWMGDNRPPDELNHISEIGQHFGFPYCHGGEIPDPEFGSEGDCDQYRAPAQNLGPHVAALGMRFYDGESFPVEYDNQIFIAEHGSWNRSVPIGYRVTLVRHEDGQNTSYETFAEGWLRDNGQAWGRPVDVHLMPDGSMLVSDDAAGAIYRIHYTGNAQTIAEAEAESEGDDA